MDFKANIETRESVEAKAKAAFGFDLSIFDIAEVNPGR